MKHPILYANELWKRNWVMAPLLIVFGVAIAFVYRSQRDLPWLLAECFGGAGVILLFFGAFRWQSYVQATDHGLRVNWTFPFQSTDIPYGSIRAARVAPIKNAFLEGRRSYVNNVTKPLITNNAEAVFIRLAPDEAEVARITKRLGRRYVFDGTVAVPVGNPAELAEEVNQRLPKRQLQQNLGGSRRSKRSR